MTSPLGKSERLYGKGELAPAERALLVRVISMVQESHRLGRERRGLAAITEKLLLAQYQLRADLDEHLRALKRL